MFQHRSLLLASVALSALAWTTGPALSAAETASHAATLPTKQQVEDLLSKSQDWLLAQQQPNGTFTPAGTKLTLGLTELATSALIAPPGLEATDPRIAKAIAYILSCRRPDGGIYIEEEGLNSYATSVGVLALVASGAGDAQTLSNAQKFLLAAQVNQADAPCDGGIGYGTSQGQGHADLSNTHLAIDALLATGLKPDDAHLQHVITFLEHCQQLSAVNKLPWVDMSETEVGGGVYTPEPRRRAPPAGATPTTPPPPLPKPTSYGSMTLALISSYTALSVKPDDSRVNAALTWIKSHYTIDANPGRTNSSDGLYYYYWTMSKTFADLKTTTLTLSDGRTVDWRSEIFSALEHRAKIADADPGKGGLYWLNDAKTWSETNPVLVTIYVIETLKRIERTL